MLKMCLILIRKIRLFQKKWIYKLSLPSRISDITHKLKSTYFSKTCQPKKGVPYNTCWLDLLSTMGNAYWSAAAVWVTKSWWTWTIGHHGSVSKSLPCWCDAPSIWRLPQKDYVFTRHILSCIREWGKEFLTTLFFRLFFYRDETKSHIFFYFSFYWFYYIFKYS